MSKESLQKLKSSLNRGVATISLKTSSTLEKAKLQTHMESVDTEVQQMISTAGEMAYGIWQHGDTEYTEIVTLLLAIQEKRHEIELLQAQIQSLHDREKQILGAAAMERIVPVGESEQICTNCGAHYPNAVKFCRNCGQKLPYEKVDKNK